MRLQGKVAVITGAGSGIGRAAAERFVAEGASVVGADINQDALDAVATNSVNRSARFGAMSPASPTSPTSWRTPAKSSADSM